MVCVYALSVEQWNQSNPGGGALRTCVRVQVWQPVQRVSVVQSGACGKHPWREKGGERVDGECGLEIARKTSYKCIVLEHETQHKQHAHSRLFCSSQIGLGAGFEANSAVYRALRDIKEVHKWVLDSTHTGLIYCLFMHVPACAVRTHSFILPLSNRHPSSH